LLKNNFIGKPSPFFIGNSKRNKMHEDTDPDSSEIIEGTDTLTQKTIKPNIDIESETPSNKHNFRRATISIVLEDYDSVFSDFDPRPYSMRDVSVDFLDECKRRVQKTSKGGFEINILVPSKFYSEQTNMIIMKRLRDFFAENAKILHKQMWWFRIKSILWLVVGMVLVATLSAVGVYLESLDTQYSTWSRIITNVFDPAGWFVMWSGLDLIFFKVEERTPEYAFYTKMVSNLLWE
jgi:hypothetical protein